jgi:hypothetical protein
MGEETREWPLSPRLGVQSERVKESGAPLDGAHGSFFRNMRNRLAVLAHSRWSGCSSPPSTRRTFFVSLTALKKRMPPKKAPVQEKKVLLGRPSNNLKIGIVGAFLPMPFRSSSKTFVLTQVFPTLASHLSSTSCPKQVTTFLSHPTACRTDPRVFFRSRKGCQLSLRDH